jgi:hypothetical protein
MSHENVVRFMEKMLADEKLKAEVGALRGDGGPDSVTQLLQVATLAGFPFAEQHLDDFFLAMAANETEGELTAEQLETVAGGLDLIFATQSMREMDQTFNLSYLQLQQDMQAQNRQFTAVSNIMKVKHDTAKAAIDNVR